MMTLRRHQNLSTKSKRKRNNEMSGAAKVLVVNDEENIKTMLRVVLESEDFSVTAVGTVAEALAQITQFRFDVLISVLNWRSRG
ncbi:MAG: hypothetical protein WAN76_07980 [Candidatus Sulfotelmatobacter sp.]